MSEEPQGIFERATTELERYEQMTEVEKKLGVSDPEREAIDAAIESRVADAVKHCEQGLSNLQALGAFLAQPKPEDTEQ
jgi:hypothetical protein